MIGVLVQFDRKDWALVGLVLVFRVLVSLRYWPYFLVELTRDPFGLVMESVGAFLGACVFVYLVKRVFNWYRALPDAE